jgi:site-specific recombinase XerD
LVIPPRSHRHKAILRLNILNEHCFLTSTPDCYECLCNVGPDRWAIHVPLGKFKTERMVPINAFVCELVQRLRFFRSFDPLPPDGRLLSRPHGKQALIRQLRYCLHEVTAAAGITTRIVPHQLRHTYASEMIRSSVTLPALMKLLGHADLR